MLLSLFRRPCEPCGNCDTCAEPPTIRPDGTIATLKALSCIHRTEERFGQAYIVEVLLGGADERIAGFGHDKISTYGIGKEHDARTWRAILQWHEPTADYMALVKLILAERSGGVGASQRVDLKQKIEVLFLKVYGFPQSESGTHFYVVDRK